MHHIPADMEELVTHYGRLIPFVIHKVIPHHLSPEDLQDLQQDVYVVVMTTDYLTRCRAYAATVETYSFTSSLRELVKNVALKFLRRRHAQMRDPQRETRLPTTTHNAEVPLDRAFVVEPVAEAQALVASRVERVRRHLSAQHRVIGRRPATAVLDEALQTDGALSKYALKRMKHYVEDLHA